MTKLKDLLKEVRVKGISLSDIQIPAVATKDRKKVQKLLKKLRIPIKPHEMKGAPQRTIYAMDKKHIMTFVNAMKKADMFWMIPMGGSEGPKSKIGKPLKEELLNEKSYVDMNATFELKGFGGNDVYIKGKKLDITLSFKGKDLQNAVKNGKGKGKVVMAGVKTHD